MELTRDNYHSSKANIEFMSNSQFGDFLKCPAAANARIFQGYDSAPKKAFELGGYVDCQLLTPEEYPYWYDKHLDAMIDTGLVSKRDKKTPNADLRIANQMIEKAGNDKLFMEYLRGERQNIYTFKFGGVMWRAMMDVVNVEENRIVDLKTTKSIHEESWIDSRTIFDFIAGSANEWGKGPFYESYSYWRQMALYQYAVEYVTGKELECYIAAVSKETPPDLSIIHFSDYDRLGEERALIEAYLPQVIRWKKGIDDAPRCEACEYCRETKLLKSIEDAVNIRRKE